MLTPIGWDTNPSKVMYVSTTILQPTLRCESIMQPTLRYKSIMQPTLRYKSIMQPTLTPTGSSISLPSKPVM